MKSLPAAVFLWPIRIYYEDTDAGGIVYHTNYLRYCERARTEWLRSRGWSQAALAREAGIVFSVVSLDIEYRRPARLDDELVVSCEPTIAGGASLLFVQQVRRAHDDAEGELLAQAQVRVACVDAAAHRPRRMPPDLRRSLALEDPN